MNRIKQLTLALALKTLGSDLIQNFMRDLKSLRALWNWIYMALFVWVCAWTVLYHPEHIPTVITVSGSVVGIIFTGYVLSKAYEKAYNGHNEDNPPR
jgi:hypothetical protein